MRKLDVERKLLQALLEDKKPSQRNFGDLIWTSRLSSAKLRLKKRGFPVKMKMVYTSVSSFGYYYMP